MMQDTIGPRPTRRAFGQLQYLAPPSTESCTAITTWASARDDTSSRLVAWTQAANHRCRRLLTAIGMSEVDRFVKYELDQVLYALTW
jgi:RimJ/RimL family protein N-acetyltransferase